MHKGSIFPVDKLQGLCSGSQQVSFRVSLILTFKLVPPPSHPGVDLKRPSGLVTVALTLNE